MLRFAVIGTNWITAKFVEAAHHTGRMRLAAVYSRHAETAATFCHGQNDVLIFTSMEELARCEQVDAVYIASPNSLHAEQALFLLSHKKHVICEKPLASNSKEVDALIACAQQNHVVLLEAFKTAYLPNFIQLKQSLNKIGKFRKAFINYCQYSSRYPRYLKGENPNTFNPMWSSGSIMDIGYYCLASAIALFGEPLAISAQAELLESGVDAHGFVSLKYNEAEVILSHSKVSDSHIPSEIQGEEGTFIIEKISECQGVSLIQRGGETQIISQQQHDNTMQYEAEHFVNLVQDNAINHPGLTLSRSVAQCLTEIRRQTGVVFPADGKLK